MQKLKKYQFSSKKDMVMFLLCSSFGLGLSPIAPGTFGALLGVIIHLVIYYFTPTSYYYYLMAAAFITICILTIALTKWAENYWNDDDPAHFVLDEVAGYLIVPILFSYGSNWNSVIWGFLLFRIFDIIKLPLARQIDRNMKGGWGILLDDLVSSVYAVLVMYFLVWLNQKMNWHIFIK
jgi:phosphatidylglycerophosphatase A